MSEFYMIFAWQCPNFSWHLSEKYFPRNFRGHVPPAPRLLRRCIYTQSAASRWNCSVVQNDWSFGYFVYVYSSPHYIGVGAQSTLGGGGHKIFARKVCIIYQQNSRILPDSCPKNYQNTRVFMIFARKFYKIPEFYMIFCPKNARILHNNCPKNIFPEF